MASWSSYSHTKIHKQNTYIYKHMQMCVAVDGCEEEIGLRESGGGDITREYYWKNEVFVRVFLS